MKESLQPALTQRIAARKAFTLIELLVVIAIIAILAAILFPVFGRARENARRSSCQSNLKQITLGIMQYSQDYDERYPLYAPVGGNASTVTTPYGWADSLQPYLKSEQIFQCPSDPNPPPTAPTATERAASPGYTDYIYNVSLSTTPAATSPNPGPGPTGVSQAVLEQPTLTLMLTDGLLNSTNPTEYQKGNARFCSRGSADGAQRAQENTIQHTRHLDGINFAFADGHVKWYRGQVGQTGVNGGLANVWNSNTPFATSKQDPTFHPYDAPGLIFPRP